MNAANFPPPSASRPAQPTGGELLARTLKAAGVSHIFALHGGHLEAFYRACLDHDLTLVDSGTRRRRAMRRMPMPARPGGLGSA